MPVQDFPERTPDRGPMILYRITLALAVAVCLVLAVSASAKSLDQPQSRESQLAHPCPATGLRSSACPGSIKTTLYLWPAEGLTHPQTCNGKRLLARRPRIGGRRRAALVRRDPSLGRRDGRRGCAGDRSHLSRIASPRCQCDDRQDHASVGVACRHIDPTRRGRYDKPRGVEARHSCCRRTVGGGFGW